MKILAAVFSFLVFSLWLARAAYATDFSSSNFIVRDPVTSGGGGYSSSNSFQLWSSFAQLAIGTSTSNSNQIQSGFLYFPEAAASPPASTPPTSPPPGTGSGSITTPIPPAPPIGLPPIVPILIEFITGERVPPECAGVNRSDLNCDGRVDLKDLSVLFSRPRAVTTRTLSLLFADWTERLPALRGEPTQLAVPEETETVKPPPTGLAQVKESVSATTTKQVIKPAISLWRGFVKLVKLVFVLIARLFGF